MSILTPRIRESDDREQEILIHDQTLRHWTNNRGHDVEIVLLACITCSRGQSFQHAYAKALYHVMRDEVVVWVADWEVVVLQECYLPGFGPPTDRFILTIRNVPTDLESGTAFDAERGTPIATVNLMPADGYQLVPNAEFDDTAVIVLPAGSIVALSAAWQAGNDRVSVEKLVKIEP